MKVQDPQLLSEEVKCHKGRATDHRKQNRDPKIPDLHVDYCFLGSAADTRPRYILVAKQFGVPATSSQRSGCAPS